MVDGIDPPSWSDRQALTAVRNVDSRLDLQDTPWSDSPATPSLFRMTATTVWALPLTRRLAVDHGRMRSSLCRCM